ncbi:hypothetical protein [Nonomuraea diastatica]|uniref:DUF3093 domain-containing protein n=1 Tax=Nonomuraea diastatica TaxID=1848329 RepID=A0A4R4WZT9_9ACTN|nr:hypothetical protein [Nonomuraea diastatica]TDD23404.1 hypothetical protein E1294_09095 [Nonomuraea diastatica]
MKIRYNPLMGWTFLILGSVLVLLQVWLLLLGSFSPTIVVGLIVAGLGVVYLRRPYFRVEPQAIVLAAPIGPAERRFPIPAGGSPRLEGNRIVIDEAGRARKVPVRKGMAHPADWAAYTTTLPHGPQA